MSYSTAPVLSSGHPAVIADLFDNHTITWTTGWGDVDTRTCLHGALLRPCAVPGDEIMWSALLSYRGLTLAWNDRQPGVESVVSALRAQADPDEAEMVVVFGPNWEAGRSVCRRYAAMIADERDQLRDAWAARAAWAARDARAARDAWAARDARAAWDAWAARDARAAFVGTIAEPWYGTPPEWTVAAHDRLLTPWNTVVGGAGRTQ